MKSLSQFLERERQTLRKEWKQLIMPILVILLVLWMWLFRSDPVLASQSVSFNPQVPNSHWVLPVDLDRLAHAVSVAETGGCRLGTGKSHNNCVGIMSWKGGKRHPKHYIAKEDSLSEFAEIWGTHYGRFPTLEDAKRWTGGDSPEDWLAAVKASYASI